MKISIIAVGRLKAGPERSLVQRYVERISKAGPAQAMVFDRIVEVPESRASNASSRKREESASILKELPRDGVLMLLDEGGTICDSPAFAERLARLRDEGCRDLVLAIGGADGHDCDLKARADAVVSLGRMTWPHQMVRIMIAEQVYRAVTIFAGHPYHRD